MPEMFLQYAILSLTTDKLMDNTFLTTHIIKRVHETTWPGFTGRKKKSFWVTKR